MASQWNSGRTRWLGNVFGCDRDVCNDDVQGAAVFASAFHDDCGDGDGSAVHFVVVLRGGTAELRRLRAAAAAVGERCW